MNWKNRLTNYNFWISLFSAALLILQALKIEFDIAYVNEIFTAVLGLLVVIGIISDPTRTSIKSTESSVKTSTQTEKLETKKEKEETKTEIPTQQENKDNNVAFKDDMQAILTKISCDLDIKIKELEELNKNSIEKLQYKTSNEEKTSIKEEEPAVAEISNPYIDVIN